MNIPFPDKESKKYFIAWIILVPISCSVWFLLLDDFIETMSFAFIILFGLVVGIISGLQPVKAFQACFLGLLIFIIYLIPTGFHIFSIVFIALPSLFALTGAIFRKIILGQEIEIHLKRWQWTLLIGGLILFSDGSTFMLLGTLSVDSFFLSCTRFFIPMLLGLFCAGVFTGIFANMEQKKLVTSVLITSLGSHLLPVIYIFYIIIDTDKIYITDFGPLLLMGLFSISVSLGTRIGCKWRKNKFIKILHEK